MEQRIVLITGASSGIGTSAARLFAAAGDRVVLSARRQERMEGLRDELKGLGHQALVLAANLAEVSQAEALVGRTVEAAGRIDVLVNNAGYGMQCRFEEMSPSEVGRMFAVNVLSAMALARAAAQEMRPRGAGSIINVASVGGVVAHPLNVAYCSSKHALVGFSKSLRLELLGSGVGVTAVCPGATRTEFFDVARRDIPFDKMIEKFSAPPETVARSIVRASRRNRALVFPTWSAWFLYFLDRWFPWISQLANLRYRDSVLKESGQ